MNRPMRLLLPLLLACASLVQGQQQCYYAAGAKYRGPTNLVPCSDDGPSACCLLGDTCLSGNACYNYKTGDTYQYGCTDISYKDASCPFKCGFDPVLSPWTALEYCTGVQGVEDTWVCESPESCGCQWNATYDLLVLPVRGCQAMGSDARAALYAPSAIAPFISLPQTFGGSTGYYSGTTISGTSTWITTAIKGYTPSSITPLTTYAKAAPTSQVILFADQTPDPSTNSAAHSLGDSSVPPVPSSGWPAPTDSVSSSASPVTPNSQSTHPATRTSKTSSSNTAAAKTSSSSSPTPTPSTNGLSTGAKVGIGVGVAGGVCLLAAIAIVFIFFRRRKSQNTPNPEASPGPQYAPYGGEKPGGQGGWNGQPYPPGGSPHGYHYNPSYAYQGVPAVIHEAGSTPAEEETVRKRLSPQEPPVEMEAQHVVQEMESRSPSQPDASPAK